MKVADAMEKDVVQVSPNTPILHVANLIFGHGLNGVPVVDRGKLVGMITERDILSKLFPSLKEYVEDPVHEGNFEDMEEKAREILKAPAEDIMNTDVKVVTQDTPLLKADSLMEIHKVGRLPVVKSASNPVLIGIIAKRDIFKAVVGKNLQLVWGQEEFHDWFASVFDRYVSWEKRLKKEVPLIAQALKNRGEKVIDIGCGTGEHALALAKLGYEVLGIDQSENMIKIASGKIILLPKKLRENVSFRKMKMEELSKKISEKFDSAIILGGVIAHARDLKSYLSNIVSVLNKDKNTIVIQVPSYENILKEKRRFNSMEFVEPISKRLKELALLTFYDFRDDGLINLNAVELERVGEKWEGRGVATTALSPYTRTKIISALESLGYRRIGVFRDHSYAVFNPEDTSSGLIIVAKK